MGGEMGESLGAHGPDRPICIVYSHRPCVRSTAGWGLPPEAVLWFRRACTPWPMYLLHTPNSNMPLPPPRHTQWQWRKRMTPWAVNGFRDTTDGVLLSWQLWRNENSRLPSLCPSQPSVYQEWSAVGISLGGRTQSPHWMSFWILSFAFVLSFVRNWGKG